MKIAISGKGGVGKTLLASLLASLLSTVFVEFGYSVIAIDADPDANLAATLGFIPYNQAVVEAALANLPPLDASQQIIAEVNMPTPDEWRERLNLQKDIASESTDRSERFSTVNKRKEY